MKQRALKIQANHSHTTNVFSLARIAVGNLVLALCAVGTFAQQPDWIEFHEQTCRIVNDPMAPPDIPCGGPCEATTCGNDDDICACGCEKDIAVGDLDGDGDMDMVIVRKQPMYLPGGASNMLFLNVDGIMVDVTADLAPGFADLTEDRDVVIEDVNRDPPSNMNMPDVVTAATFGEPPRVTPTARLPSVVTVR